MNDTDVMIIGGGPVGLYAAFYVCLRGLSVRVVEARPELGGQLSALYPEKWIYDVPGFPRVRAVELIAGLERQLCQFSPQVNLGELALELTREEDAWRVTTDGGTYTARAVILTAGIGALLPRAASLPREPGLPEVWLEFPAGDQHGKRVLVYGGVPQALEAALKLRGGGARVTLAHKRALFRGTPEQQARLEALRVAGEITVFAPADLLGLRPGGALLGVQGEQQPIEIDAVYHANGYLPDLAPLRGWGLEWQGEYVMAGAGQGTNLPGVFVAGDLSSSGGDLKLLSAGFAEGAVAANRAVHFVRPDLKVRPGHSSDKKLPVTSAL